MTNVLPTALTALPLSVFATLAVFPTLGSLVTLSTLHPGRCTTSLQSSDRRQDMRSSSHEANTTCHATTEEA